jgi:hypothetical protein
LRKDLIMQPRLASNSWSSCLSSWVWVTSPFLAQSINKSINKHFNTAPPLLLPGLSTVALKNSESHSTFSPVCLYHITTLFCTTGAWNRGLHLEPLHQSYFCDFFFFFFWDRVSWTICPGWLQTEILLISASCRARITGVSPRAWWHYYLLEASLCSLHLSHTTTHQSSLAEQQLHSSLAGTPPCGWTHLIQHFSHRKIIPGCDPIIAACFLDQL